VELSPWSRVSFEKLLVAHLLHEFPTIHQPELPFLYEKYDQQVHIQISKFIVLLQPIEAIFREVFFEGYVT
jgi:hypothetical protein